MSLLAYKRSREASNRRMDCIHQSDQSVAVMAIGRRRNIDTLRHDAHLARGLYPEGRFSVQLGSIYLGAVLIQHMHDFFAGVARCNGKRPAVFTAVVFSIDLPRILWIASGLTISRSMFILTHD